MRCHDELESEEINKFKELYPDIPLDEDEAVFKKPKTTKVCIELLINIYTYIPFHAPHCLFNRHSL